MTSKERHEVRYQRRAARRRAKREQVCSLYDNYDNVFTISNLYQSYLQSRKNVGWKDSVQQYKANAIVNIHNTYKTMQARQFKSKGFYVFNLFERGKLRTIRSVSFKERVVQRCLCDYALTPILSRTFIYDNSASLKGKGINFAIERMTTHLHRFYRAYGANGYILQYDFSKYFDTISHDKVREIVYKHIKDPDLRQLTMSLVNDFGDIGLGLGSQVSQILSLAVASDIDHAMKEKHRAKFYGRYMDDGYIISHDKQFLKECYNTLESMCAEAGITLNTKKTHIVPISRGFTFLKIKFSLTASGKVVRRLSHDSSVRMRRKLKKLRKKVNDGKMEVRDVACSMQSWVGHTLNIDAYRTRQRMLRLFYSLYKDDLKGNKICIKY